MDAGRHARFALLLSFIALQASARPAVFKLEGQNFEAYTQAASGQTTGIWFVLFTSSHEPSLQHLSLSWEEYGRSQLAEPQQVIHGVVDVADEPDLADRFGVTSLPTFMLFKNRKMYKYGGAEGGHEELRHFCRSGFREVQALEVPPEPSPLEALLKAVRRSPWIVRALEGCAGAAIAIVGVIAIIFLKRGGQAEAVPAPKEKQHKRKAASKTTKET